MNIIERLNKIDVKELQNLDYKKLLTTLKSRPDIIIIIVAVLSALITGSKIYGDNQAKIKAARLEIQTLQEKITAIQSYQKVQGELQKFMLNIPEPITEDNLMNLITDIAVKRQVQIESFAPSQKKVETLHQMTGMSLNITTQNYKNLWLFIHDIEESKYPIHIQQWRASPQTDLANMQGGKSNEKPMISAQLEIAAINIKKE